MAESEHSPVTWRRSSFSGAQNNACVEVAGDRAALRDSKHPGPKLASDVPSLVNALRRGWPHR